jgi:transposase
MPHSVEERKKSVKFVASLSAPEQITLQCMRDSHSTRRVRMRAQAIMLSHQGFRVQEIAFISQVTRQTVSSWLDSWDRDGIAGLYDHPRSGHPMILSEEEVEFVMNLTAQEPRSMKMVAAALKEKKGKSVTVSTLKRAVKKAKLRWKRIRKSTKSKRDEKKFQRAEHKINLLDQRRIQGEVDVFYFDGSGFCLTPSLSYAWQPIGECIEVPASGNHGHRFNVLAFLNKANELTPFCFTGSVNTDAVVSCFDAFSKGLVKKSFVFIDNGPLHRSRAFIEKLPEWHRRGLIPKFLPSYSPELNLIEILWRKMKYEWLPFSSYLNFKVLKDAVETILKDFGSKYVINFST